MIITWIMYINIKFFEIFLVVCKQDFFGLCAVNFMSDVFIGFVLDFKYDFSAKIEIKQRFLVSEDSRYFMNSFFQSLMI